MYIQIDNTNFVNKGAELMLFAIIDRLSKEPDLNPKFVFGKGKARADQIRRAGLYQKVDLGRLNIPFEKLFNQYRFDGYGLVKENNINAVLDAGGFQFGDQWEYLNNPSTNNELKKYYKSLKVKGGKLIFLPQAFGPFDKPIIREQINIVHEFADLIYARDAVSYSYLVNIFGEQKKIMLSPDFTNLFKPDIHLSNYQVVKDSICIIPNSKMLTHTSEEVKNNYIPFLIKLIMHFLSNGERVILLNHEGKDDLRLINHIKEQINHNIPVLNDLNAIEVKACIKYVKLLLSSRYHGVASGLNQGVPTYCTSWSHKYKELMEVYGVKDKILEVDLSIDLALKKLQSYDKGSAVKEKISNVEEDVNLMWRKVLDVLIN